MPVVVHAEIRRPSQDEFARIAYDVMQHAFAVHREFGRLFDEDVYAREIASRCGGLTRVPIEVAHDDFRKWYYLDLLVEQAAVFEFRTVAALRNMLTLTTLRGQ